MKRWVGRYLCVVGVAHTAVGVLFFGPVLNAIASEGVFNALGQDHERQLAFWFMMLGVALCSLGALVDWLEYKQITPPARLALFLGAIAAVGICLMPVSPFWTLLPPTIVLALRARTPKTR